ncbi:DUF4362 domain-containing protein [Litchfieldia alkalitelluris]|uniref:DUF4362 domain-containing protein n=1 Tax=Litchfieldia alkalitelluris TaxID=304268 RepID=UPI00099871A5|nr:DUF4362 domain-containing protein [Litchfieldia alkalitelluris]
MKKILFFTAILLFIFSGCQSNELSQGNESPSITKQNNIPEYVQSPEDVVNMHGDITNIDKFFAFIENVKQGFEDKIRVVTYTEEGDPMLHDLKYDGEVIQSTTDTRRDTFGSGNINTAICRSIDIKENEERTDYDLTGCDKTNRDNSILVIWK